MPAVLCCAVASAFHLRWPGVAVGQSEVRVTDKKGFHSGSRLTLPIVVMHSRAATAPAATAAPRMASEHSMITFGSKCAGVCHVQDCDGNTTARVGEVQEGSLAWGALDQILTLVCVAWAALAAGEGLAALSLGAKALLMFAGKVMTRPMRRSRGRGRPCRNTPSALDCHACSC